MYKLLLFEVKRSWKFKVFALLGYLLVNFGFLYRFLTDPDYQVSELPFRILLFIIFASAFMGGTFIIGINSLRSEVKNNSRDLYFLLPLSSYKKIGSKLVLSTTEMIGATLLSTLVSLKCIEALTGVIFIETIWFQIKMADMTLLVPTLIQLLITIATMILTVYLSFAIYRSFFSQLKFGSALTVVIYILINYVLMNYVYTSIRYDMSTGLVLYHYFINNIFPLVLNFTVLSLMFLMTGYLFEHKCNFD